MNIEVLQLKRCRNGYRNVTDVSLDGLQEY